MSFRTALWTLTWCVVLAALLTPAVAAQDLPSTCIGCSVEVTVLEWNGTATPGTVASGLVRVANTGQMADSYTLTITSSDAAWLAESALDQTAELAAGSGPLADPDGAAVEFAVHMLVPETAAAGDQAGFTLTATSEQDETVTDDAGETARAAQTYAWALTCTAGVTVQKTDVGGIELTATNNGNGADSATLTTTPLAGLAVTDPAPVPTLASAASHTQAVELGVGLSLEDGDYTLRWDLKSVGSTTTTASCTTNLSVTGGTPTGGGAGGGDKKDSPHSASLALVALLLALLWSRRRA